MAAVINILLFHVRSLILTASLSTMILSDAMAATRLKNMTSAIPTEGTSIAYQHLCKLNGLEEQCKTVNASCLEDGRCLCEADDYYDLDSDSCKPRPIAPKPINLSAGDIDTDELTIDWSGGEESNFTVIIKWNPPSQDNISIFREKWNDYHNHHRITDLRSGTKYIIYIYLERENVVTILLNSIGVFTKPLPIQHITFDSYGENYTTVEWWNDPERPCTSYYVFVNEALVATVPRQGNTSIYNVTNLTGGTGYNIDVISHVQGQNSTSFKDEFYTKPKPVTSATVTQVGTHSFTVQLTKEDEGEDEKYRFYVFPNTSVEVENPMISTDKNKTISGLDPGTLYTIRIYTYYKDHESERFRTIIEYTRPLPPMNLNATKILENSLNLQWTMTDRRFDEYILEYFTLDGMDNITISIKNTTVLSYPIRNLKSGSGYFFRLYSAMNGTKSLESAVYEVYTKPKGSSEPILTQRMDTSISIQFPDDNNSYTSYQIDEQLYDRNNGYITIQNLTAGQYHTLTIFTVANYTELSLNNITFKDFTLPEQPSSIMFPAELLHETNLTVEWKNVTEGNADGYFVQFTVGDSIIEEFNDTSFANFFEFTNLTAGVRYNVTIYSFWNGERSYRTLEGSTYTRPPAPEVAIIGVTETSLTLDITDELWEGYSIIVNPVVQNDTDRLEFITEELPYEIRDLEAGTEYTIEVFSMIGGIVGENGRQVSSYTKPDRVRIDSIQADKKETNISSLAFTWKKPSMGSVDWYSLEIICTSPNGPENLMLNFTRRTNETNASVWGLEPGTFCTVNITTHVGNQTGAMTQKRVEWITDEIAPEQVQDIKIETKARSLKLLWSKPTKPNGIIRKYAVDVIDLKQNCSFNRTLFTCTNCLETSDSSCGEESASDPWTTDPCNESLHIYYRTFEDIDTLDYNVTDLHPNRNYMVVVTPFSRCYGQSSLLVNRTKQDVPSGAPTRVEQDLSRTTNENLSISWVLPEEDFQNGVITHYTVYYRYKNRTCFGDERGNEIMENFTLNAISGTNILTPNRYPYWPYEVTISAWTIVGEGPKTEPITVMTKESTPDKIRSPPTVVHTSQSSIELHWEPPCFVNGIIKHYRIQVFNDSSKVVKDFTTIWNETQQIVNGLYPYHNYTVSVSAVNMDGQEGPAVNTSKVARTKTGAPGNVGSLSLDTERNITKPRSIEVMWTDPKPRDLNGILTAFYVTYTGVSQDNITVTRKIGVEQRSFIIHDIVPGSYHVGVYASTKAGNGSKSWLSITVPPGVPIFTEESPNVPLLKESTTSFPSATQIPIQLAIDFLCNQSNGKPKYIGLIVAADSQATDKPFIGSRDDFDVRNKTYKTWFEIKSMQNPLPYITSETNWNPCKKRRIRSTGGQSETFTIGTQGDCSDVAPDTYCNGKLKPGTSYRVKAFCCTDGGCAETMYSNVVKTKEPINKATIVGSVLFVVAVTAVAICTVIYLRRKQAACFAKSAENGTTNKLSEPIEAIELAYRSRSSTESRSYPVPVSEFPDYVDKQKKDNGLLFSEAYKMIKENSPQHQMSIAKSQICRSKNRFMNILPFDHSRVKLLPLDAEECTDYINASYIPGNNSRTEYIATQGPMPSTFMDFWRMVWEQNVEIIVMLTKLFEKGHNKCYKYWPNQNEPQFYGDISVSVMFESNLLDYTTRIMELKLTGEKRTVKQFSFLKWPDMGRPEYPHLLLEFVKSVQQNKSTRSEGRPMVVHCSAGVGPTGTFIAVDHLLQHIRDHDEIDIYNLVLEMRNNRCNMVQTEAQYIYIHECIREFISNDDQEDDFDDDDNEIQHIYTNAQQEDGYENMEFAKPF